MSAVSLPASFLSIPVPSPREQAATAPPMLTPRADCVAAVKGDWFLVAVQGRFEKALAWELHDLGADYFLPLSHRFDRYKRPVAVPIWDGYLFGNGDAAHKYCFDHRRVFDVAPIALQRQFINELTSVELALHANPSLEVVEINKPGQKVRVVWGSLQGLEGEVMEIGDRDKKTGMVKVVVAITMMGRDRGVPLEIDRSLLEPSPDPDETEK